MKSLILASVASLGMAFAIAPASAQDTTTTTSTTTTTCPATCVTQETCPSVWKVAGTCNKCGTKNLGICESTTVKPAPIKPVKPA